MTEIGITGDLVRINVLPQPGKDIQANHRHPLLRRQVHIDFSKRKQELIILTGLAEGTFYPGVQYIIGSWYRKDELAKRTCIFHISSVLGAMFSGYLMAAVHHLGENSKYAGWQWYVSDAHRSATYQS